MDEKRIKIEGKGLPIRGNDLDTDRIIPARFLKHTTFTHMGEFAFYDERFNEDGGKKNHPMNNPVYSDANIMVGGNNFGCGSSREHAPQAIMGYGINAIIGGSFAEIFFGNCTAIGIPAVTVSQQHLDTLFERTEKTPNTQYTIDLEYQTLSYLDGLAYVHMPLSIPESSRQELIRGEWDTTSMLLEGAEQTAETVNRLPYFSGW